MVNEEVRVMNLATIDRHLKEMLKEKIQLVRVRSE